MKKFLLATILFTLLLCVSLSAAPAIQPIDTSNAVEVYRNTFDDASALDDFTQYNGEWGVDENGQAYILPGQAAANAYFVYTGANTALHDLSDYVVSVEMYNVRQATGLVARSDNTRSTALHGYQGINASCQTNGTYFFTRVTNNTAGTSTTSLGSSPVIFAPGANIRMEVAMRGNIVQTSVYDLESGMLLWVRSAVTDLHPSGSFGLFAYTKIMDGLDVSETRFDNLVVKTLSSISDAESFDVYATLIDVANATEVYRNTFNDASALDDFKLRGKWGVDESGRAYVLPGQANMNAYTLYNGSDTALQNLGDHIVEVDIYNLRQAEGLVARCDLAASNEAIQGYMGINANFNTAGTYAYNRVTKTDDGASSTSLGTSDVICAPGANVHLTLVMRGTTVQYIVSDLDTGRVLCAVTAETELHLSGSFGLMAYTKVVNGLDNSESRFDNLVVKTLPANTGDGYVKADYAAKQHGNDRLDMNANGMLAVHKTLTMENGTAEVQVFMPAAATKSTLQAVTGDYREDRAGLIFNRSEDGSSYYKLQMYRKSSVTTVTDGEITKISTYVYTQLYKVVNGKETKLKSFYMEAAGLGSWGIAELRVVKNGGKLYCYMNDRCYIAVEDETPLTGKGIGVFSDLADTTFANIKVSDVTECDKADLVTWGHSHIGGWYHFADEFARYGKGVNIGLGGSATNDMPNVLNEIASYAPKVVVIMIGSNNYGNGAEQNTADLKKYNEQLHALLPDAHIFVISEWWQPSRLEAYGQTVLDLNAAYRAYAAETDYVSIIEGWNIPVKDGALDESMFKDTQHLNPASYLLLNARTHSALDYVINGRFGDVDRNEIVTMEDALLALKAMLHDEYAIGADEDYDGKTTLIDILRILKQLVA